MHKYIHTLWPTKNVYNYAKTCNIETECKNLLANYIPNIIVQAHTWLAMKKKSV